MSITSHDHVLMISTLRSHRVLVNLLLQQRFCPAESESTPRALNISFFELVLLGPCYFCHWRYPFWLQLLLPKRSQNIQSHGWTLLKGFLSWDRKFSQTYPQFSMRFLSFTLNKFSIFLFFFFPMKLLQLKLLFTLNMPLDLMGSIHTCWGEGEKGRRWTLSSLPTQVILLYDSILSI